MYANMFKLQGLTHSFQFLKFLLDRSSCSLHWNITHLPLTSVFLLQSYIFAEGHKELEDGNLILRAFT